MAPGKAAQASPPGGRRRRCRRAGADSSCSIARWPCVAPPGALVVAMVAGDVGHDDPDVSRPPHSPKPRPALATSPVEPSLGRNCPCIPRSPASVFPPPANRAASRAADRGCDARRCRHIRAVSAARGGRRPALGGHRGHAQYVGRSRLAGGGRPAGRRPRAGRRRGQTDRGGESHGPFTMNASHRHTCFGREEHTAEPVLPLRYGEIQGGLAMMGGLERRFPCINQRSGGRA